MRTVNPRLTENSCRTARLERKRYFEKDATLKTA